MLDRLHVPSTDPGQRALAQLAMSRGMPELLKWATQPLAVDEGTATYLFNRVREGAGFFDMFYSEEAPALYEMDGTIAVIKVHGGLNQRATWYCSTAYDQIRRAVAAAMVDPAVEAVALNLDTPGGVVSGLFGLSDFLAKRQPKPMWCYVDELATSAGYMLAATGGKIMGPETAQVGSIGVMMMHVDQSGWDKQIGVKVSYIYAGARKVEGNSHEPLSDEARAAFQARADKLYGMFVGRVAKLREIAPGKVKSTEAGVYTADDAVSLGLLDEVATWDEFMAKLRAATPSGRRAAAAVSSTSASAQDDKPAAEDSDMKFSAAFLALMGLTETATIEDVEAKAGAFKGEATRLTDALASKDAALINAGAELSAKTAALTAAEGKVQSLEAASVRMELALERANETAQALTSDKAALESERNAAEQAKAAAEGRANELAGKVSGLETELMAASLVAAGAADDQKRLAQLSILVREEMKEGASLAGKSVREAVATFAAENPVFFQKASGTAQAEKPAQGAESKSTGSTKAPPGSAVASMGDPARRESTAAVNESQAKFNSARSIH